MKKYYIVHGISSKLYKLIQVVWDCAATEDGTSLYFENWDDDNDTLDLVFEYYSNYDYELMYVAIHRIIKIEGKA